MFKFLKENSEISSTRVTLFLGTVCTCVLVLAIAFYIIINAYKCTSIEWSGVALFLGAISAFTGTLLYGKVQQKKVESFKNTNK